MNLNLHILADELASFGARVTGAVSRSLVIERVCLFADDETCLDDCLYVIDAADVKSLPKLQTGWWLVCGEYNDAFVALGRGTLFLPEVKAVVHAIDLITALFAKYNHINEKILITGLGVDGIREIFLSAIPEELFGVPVHLGEVNRIAVGSRFQMTEGASGLTLSVSLCASDGASDCLIFDLGTRSLTQGFLSLAEYFADLVNMMLRSGCLSGSNLVDDCDIFIDLLNGRVRSAVWLDGHFNRLGWKEGETFLIVITQSKFQTASTNYSSRRMVQGLRLRFGGCFAFEYDGGAVALVRCDSYPYSPKDIRRDLLSIIKDMQVFCLVSLVFYDIVHLRDYYDQCLFLLTHESGMSKERIRFFEQDFFQHFVLYYGIEKDRSWLIDPRVALLRNYDDVNGTNLVRCLKTLIECCGNKKLAAQRLSIHYNTLLYRVSRIQEESGIDMAALENDFGSNLFQVLLSVKLLDDLK